MGHEVAWWTDLPTCMCTHVCHVRACARRSSDHAWAYKRLLSVRKLAGLLLLPQTKPLTYHPKKRSVNSFKRLSTDETDPHCHRHSHVFIIVTAGTRGGTDGARSYGVCSYGLHSYGLCSYGAYSYSVYSYRQGQEFLVLVFASLVQYSVELQKKINRLRTRCKAESITVWTCPWFE